MGPYQRLKSEDTRLANPLARVLGLENKRSIESLETVAPYYIFLPTILPMTLLEGKRGDGGTEEQKFPRPYSTVASTNFSFPFFASSSSFFSFLFFPSHFSFRGFEEGVQTCHEGQRTTHPRAQWYSTSQDRADQPDLEGISTASRPITKGDTFTHLFPLHTLASFHPYLDFYLFCSSFCSPFELTVPESHRTRFPSRRGHRCALERFLNVFDLLRIPFEI